MGLDKSHTQKAPQKRGFGGVIMPFLLAAGLQQHVQLGGGVGAGDEIIGKVTVDMLDYTMDTDVLLAARAELAWAIMSGSAE